MAHTKPSEEQMTPIQRFGEGIADRVERWMPSPFLFVIILTYVAAILAFVLEGAGVVDIAQEWHSGFWNLLEFGMQMVILLVASFVIAYHTRVQKIIRYLVRLPNSGRQAIVMVGIVAMAVGWISWALSLIFGAILAREMGEYADENEIEIHYPLVAVAGYLGMSFTYGWGLSNSAGLLMATDGNVFMEAGVVDRVITATEWVFHPYPLILTTLGITYAAVILFFLTPPKNHAKGISNYIDQDEKETDKSKSVSTDGSGARKEESIKPKDNETLEDTHSIEESKDPADRINNSKILGGIIALTGTYLFFQSFLTSGLDALNMNVLNLGFLMIGLLLYQSPVDYLEEFYDAVRSSAGIVLQFPFYAGIMGIMEGTGLIDTMAQFLLSVATPETFPIIAWLTAAIMNIFVPSGGGEWTIVGGAMLTAGEELGIPHGQTLAAYAVGDAHTNLFNPFWAIPTLAITGLRARDMFGYAITVMLLLTPFLAIALYILPY